ncbi:U3 small nucleolar RNA-interacting protein 2 [Phyllobates terribilis]|uniref:U3 small nucleolar RNA-interacting protein 2 n=1 Tax=Phyllobates terribilis TaxID=111132 RepID=UPI003CCA9487
MSGLFIKRRPEGPGKKRRGEVKDAEEKKKLKVNLREEIESDSDTELPPTHSKEDNEEELEETPQEKKLRLAKEYLRQLQEQEEERLEDASEDVIAHRLQENVLEQRGKLQRPLAKELLPPEPAEIRLLRGHQGPVTCLVISPDDKHVFSGSKDCAIIKWSISDGKKIHKIPGGRKGCEDQHIGHTAHILCMALSSDGKYLASGDANKLIYIWNAETCQRLHKFQGHRGPVSGLSFQKGTYQLFSASHDRSVKVWNVAENAYIETLFGHQDCITGLDSLSRERCVTSGGRDGTVRVWKITEETQLVFSGHDGSIDCIRLINEEHMVSGADDGSLALWNVSKKKPLARRRCAHGSHGEAGLEQPYWVSAVAAALNSDVVASGSHDGNLRIWQCAENFKGLQPLCTIPLVGFVNSLQFSSSADFLVAGVGQEHRLGRWWRLKPAKNGLYIVPFRRKPPLAEGS